MSDNFQLNDDESETPQPVWKGGRLSHEEMNFIRKYVKTHGVDAVSNKLNRSPEVIRKFCNADAIIIEGDSVQPIQTVVEASIVKQFKKTPEWDALKEELIEQELDYFEFRFGKLVGQFKNDVLPSEETQIFHLIKLEILMQRNLRGAKKSLSDIRRLEMELTKIYGKYTDGKDMPDTIRNFVLNLENQLLSARSAQQSKSTEYVKLQEKHSAIMKELKATRDQRITKADNAKKDFLTLLKQFQEADYREAEGKQMAMVQLATRKEMKRLTEYHEYIDGTVDKPILNAEDKE